MDKHYRGKRHTYARRSVAVGRQNKRNKKMKRFINLLRSLDFRKMARDMVAFSNSCQESAEIIGRTLIEEYGIYEP